MGANVPQWKGQDRTQDRTQISCIFEEGRGWLHLEINFPSPSRHYMGANAPQWKGQDRTGHRTGRTFPVFSKGGGGELHLEINFPSPSRHYMSANAPQWKGQDRTQDGTHISCIFEGGRGGGVTPRNKFPIPEQTLYGCKCATVGTQHYTNVHQIPGGEGDGQPQTLNRVMNQFW